MISMYRDKRFLAACAVFYWGCRMRLIITALLGATALSLACAPGALAADMPARTYTKAPAMVNPAYNWTGFYIGAHAGYGFGTDDVSVNFLPSATAFGIAPVSMSTNPRGFIGGAQAGYNWQTGAWVFGAEVDYSYANISGDATSAPMFFFPPPGFVLGSFHQVHEKIDWFGTARLRFGVTPIDRLLVYATGGLAFGHAEYSSLTFLPGSGPTISGSDSATKTGWTVGGGFEWAFVNNWSAKAEYLYYDLGNHTLISSVGANPGFPVQNEFQTNGHIVRVGINYKLGN
jgi:outer membrane immunogenic protein